MKKIAAILLLLATQVTVAQSLLEKITPDHLTVQLAGSTGFVSAGPGYRFFNDKLEAEGLYGYVPVKFGGELHILTGRIVYQPLHIPAGKSFQVTPLMISGFVTYHLGDRFYIMLPDHYPDGYYKWSTAIRYHAGLGSSVTLKTGHQQKHGLTFYYELNTNDLYYKSYMANKTISLNDIIMLGLGVKIF